MPAPAAIELLEAALAKYETLPTLASEAIQAAFDETKSIDQLCDLIGRDQSLSASVLRLANSPFYGRPMRVSDLGTAGSMLGLDTLRALLLGSVMSAAAGQAGVDTPWLETLWDHAAACAALAQRLAPPPIKPGVAAAAGLLHDLGRLLMLTAAPRLFAALAERMVRSNARQLEIEEETFGLDHTQVGKKLALRWQLPPSLVWVMEAHHTPFSPAITERERPLVQLVALVDALTYRVGFGAFKTSRCGNEPDRLAAALGLSNEKIEQALARLPDEAERWRSVLGKPGENVEKMRSKALSNLWLVGKGYLKRATRAERYVSLLKALNAACQPSILESRDEFGKLLQQPLAELGGLVSADYLDISELQDASLQPLATWSASDQPLGETELRAGVVDALAASGRFISQPELQSEEYAKVVLVEKLESQQLLVLTARGDAPGLPFFPEQVELLEFFCAELASLMRRQKMARALIQAKSFASDLIEHFDYPVLVLDAEGRLIYANTACQRLLGLPATSDPGTHSISSLLRKLGTAPDLVAQLEEALPQGAALDFTVTADCPDHERRYFRVKGGRQATPEGKPGYVLSFYDVTELMLTNQQLLEYERKSLLFDTAVALNHELNSPLCAITMTADLLATKLANEAVDIKSELDTIKSMAEKCATILARLREIEAPRRVEYIGGTSMLDLSGA